MEKGITFYSHRRRVDALSDERPESHRSIQFDSRLTIGCLLIFGTFITLINLRWPVTRNALDYMKATVEIIERHFDLISVAREHDSIGGKPLLFSLMATPFVWLFGANSGIVVASTVGTGVFIVSALFTLDCLSRISRGKITHSTSLGLIITALNPLVLYQFWSGYPDSLFAGLVLFAFCLSDAIAEGDVFYARRRTVLLGLTIGLAVHTKLYGAILLLTCPLYILMRCNDKAIVHALIANTRVCFTITWSTLIAMLLLAKLGYDPLLTLDANSGFDGYAAIFRRTVVEHTLESLQMLCFSTVLTFHIALLFLLKGGVWRAYFIPPAVFIGIYTVGLIPFKGTAINMRYFLPAFPFIAFILVSGACSTSLMARRVILYSYSVVAIALTLNFNVAWVAGFTDQMTARAYLRCPDLMGWLDNLRMPVQISLRRQIDTINKNVPDGSILYWSSDYYKTTTHGLAYHLGVKKTLDVRYILEPSYPQYSDQPVFLAEFMPAEPRTTLWRAPSWATPVSYGNGLFRLDPASVRLESLSGDFVTRGGQLKIRADLNSRDPYTVRAVEFIEAGYTISRTQRPPFEMTWPDPTSGRHEIFARVDYAERPSIVSSPLDVYVGIQAFERIADETDDLFMEFEDGMLNATQDLLWLDQMHRIVGIRFRNIDVGRAAPLAEVHLQFTAARSQTRPTKLDIQAEFSPNPGGLRLEDGELSKRPRTTSHVIWEPGPWVAGQTVESPDLGPLLEQVVSQEEWRNGNSLVILIQVSGADRPVQAATENGRSAPRLRVTLK